MEERVEEELEVIFSGRVYSHLICYIWGNFTLLEDGVNQLVITRLGRRPQDLQLRQLLSVHTDYIMLMFLFR